MFYNLGTLNDRVQSIEERLLKNFQSQVADYLDLKQLSKSRDRKREDLREEENDGCFSA